MAIKFHRKVIRNSSFLRTGVRTLDSDATYFSGINDYHSDTYSGGMFNPRVQVGLE